MRTETMPIEVVIAGIFAGMMLAVLIVGYKKLFLGKFVKALMKNEANSPRTAQSFSDLNIKKNFLYSLALRANSSLRIIVHESAEENGKYYIPEKHLYRALRVYGGKDVDPLMLAFLIILLLAALAVTAVYLPSVLEMIVNSGVFS